MESETNAILDGDDEGPREDADRGGPFANQRVALVGKLGGMNRPEARRLLREQGAVPQDQVDDSTDLVVIGADELPLDEQSLLDESAREWAASGKLEIISETQLWQRLGLVENEQYVRRLYTPAMLADLLGVPVAIIRRWHRRGLIVPAREVHRLPYFDFQEVSSARRLGELLAAGASPHAIEKKLESLANWVPSVDRPLAQLSIIVEGRQLLLRQGEGLIEPGGQLRIDFDALEEGEQKVVDDQSQPTISIGEMLARQPEIESPEQLVQSAAELEDQGQLAAAADMYRAAMVAGGPTAESCFRLAETLYMSDNVQGARERYSMAIELDEDFVEARANLGCVLNELSEHHLAIAAFQGALALHPDYPDVHFHLARTLDEIGQPEEAVQHWQRFLALAPESPWAAEATSRLDLTMFDQ